MSVLRTRQHADLCGRAGRVFQWMHDALLGVVHLRITGAVPSVVTVAAILTVVGWVVFRRRSAAVLAGFLVIAAAAAQWNTLVLGYPTTAAVLGHPPVVDADLDDVESAVDNVVRGWPLEDQWTPPKSMPPVGDVVEAEIPGTVSGFRARPASIYVPPAYLAEPRADLPVLVLLTGQPGHVTDWIQGGHLARTMDTFAAAHDGLAPVVVVADGLGDTDANPMCMDSNLGNAFTYLSVDVPSWMKEHLQVSTDASRWAIGGYSYGGTCALQTAVLAPTVYPTFLDISGEDEPRRGTRADSIASAFGDDDESVRRFDSVAPLTVLAQRRFDGSAGAFVVGAQDEEFRPQTARAFDVAERSGMDVHYSELPGGHSMDVWAPALEQEMDWLGARMGLVD